MLCLYTGVVAVIEARVTVPADPVRWVAKPGKGSKFADKDGTGEDGGVTGISLKASAENKAGIVLKGKGENLPDPVLALALPAEARFVNLETDVCLAATFDSGDVKKSDATRFKATAKN